MTLPFAPATSMSYSTGLFYRMGGTRFFELGVARGQGWGHRVGATENCCYRKFNWGKL